MSHVSEDDKFINKQILQIPEPQNLLFLLLFINGRTINGYKKYTFQAHLFPIRKAIRLLLLLYILHTHKRTERKLYMNQYSPAIIRIKRLRTTKKILEIGHNQEQHVYFPPYNVSLT